jgi:peptidoglycan/xylan/chitin deacetylase (PgdA/CDA1 family)
MPFALWSIDTRDWQTHSIAKNIAGISHAKNGDILIMHDIHEASVASMPAMIAKLKSEGFNFLTVSELLGLSPDNQELGKRCYKK